MSEVRVRIAPSPSGFLHVGVARTAIFNWLYARHTGGTYILRIEDTDRERSSKEMVNSILDSLTWLGLDWDEGPYFQSERWDRYQPYLDRLLEEGKAYRCFCTPEELQHKRQLAQKQKADYKYDRTCLRLSSDEVEKRISEGMPYALRLKVPDGETAFNDMVYGRLARQNQDIEDLVICRSDGRPVYNFVVVIDDHEMGVTDIIRGNDHQTNTFKQVLLYQALGLDVPRMAHLPLICDQNKKKISKRDKAANASDYGKDGFLPAAVVNYLALLGWSPKDDREVLTIPELIAAFTIENVNKSNAIFDQVKMQHINAEHMRKLSNHELAQLVAPRLIAAELTSKYWLETRWQYLMDVVGLLKERCVVLNDFVDKGRYFFQPPTGYDQKGKEKHFSPDAAERLEELAGRFAGLDRFSRESCEQALTDLSETLGIKKAQLIHPTRLAVSGVTAGPGLYDMLVVLGREAVVERMRTAIDYIRERVRT